MTKTRVITYLFDPLCGWCYGASPVLDNLAARGDFTLKLAATGLFAGEAVRPMDKAFAAYAWANDERIARLTGQRFSETYRRDVLGDRIRLFDSGPATLALTAVASSAQSREFEVLKAIQRARYVDGRDITSAAVLAHVLRQQGASDAAERIEVPDGDLLATYLRRVEAVRADMRHFGIDGVPTLIVGEGESRRLVRSKILFGSMSVLLTELEAA